MTSLRSTARDTRPEKKAAEFDMPEELLLPVRLASEGFGGTPEQIAAMRVDYVLAAAEFSRFRSEYEETFAEINRESKK